METVRSAQKTMDTSQTSDLQTSPPTHVPRRPLPTGRVYHFNVVYNHAKAKLARTADTEMSLDWTRRTVESLQLMGLVNSYYHDRDCPVGQGLVQELARVLAGSEVTVVVLSPGFVRDCWPRYSQLTSFKSLFNTAPFPSPSTPSSSFQSSSYSAKSSNASDRFSPKGENRSDASEVFAESPSSTKSLYSSPVSVYSTTNYSSKSYSKTSDYSSTASAYSTSSYYSSSFSMSSPQPSSSTYSSISSASLSPCFPTSEPVAPRVTSSQGRSSGCVILVALGLDSRDLPSGVKASDVLFFSKDWQSDDEAWSRLRTATLSSLSAGSPVWDDGKDEENACVVTEESEHSSRERASTTVQLPKGTESRRTVIDLNGNCDVIGHQNSPRYGEQEKEDRKPVASSRAKDFLTTSCIASDSVGSVPLGTNAFYETASRREHDSGETSSTGICDIEKSSATNSSSRLYSRANVDIQKCSGADTYLPANYCLGMPNGTAASYVEEKSISNSGATHRVYKNCDTSPIVNDVVKSSATAHHEEVHPQRTDGVDSRHSPLSEESPWLHLIHQNNMTASQDPLSSTLSGKPDTLDSRMMDTHATSDLSQFSNIPSTQCEDSAYGPSKDKPMLMSVRKQNPPRIQKDEVESAVLHRLGFAGVKREAWNITAIGLNRETTTTESDSSSSVSSLDCEVGSGIGAAECHGQQTQTHREAQDTRHAPKPQTLSASEQTLVNERIQTTSDSPTSKHHEENPDESEDPRSTPSSGSEPQVTPGSVTLGGSEHTESATPSESENAGAVPLAGHTIATGLETLLNDVSSLSGEIKAIDVVDSGVICSAEESRNTAMRQSGEPDEPQATVMESEALSHTSAKPGQSSCSLTNSSPENHMMEEQFTQEETSIEKLMLTERPGTIQHFENGILDREGTADSATQCQHAAAEMRVSLEPTTEEEEANNSTARGQGSEEGGFANVQLLSQSELEHVQESPFTQTQTEENKHRLLTHPETSTVSETVGDYNHITSIEDDHHDLSFNSDFLSTSLTSDYGTMSPRNDISGNSDSGFLSFSSVGDSHSPRNALQTAASPRVRDIIRGLGELDSGLDLQSSESTREQSCKTEIQLKGEIILTKENIKNTSAFSNHSGLTGKETQSETVIADVTLDEKIAVQTEQNISPNSQKTTLPSASDQTLWNVGSKTSVECDTKYSQYSEDVSGFVPHGGDLPEHLKVDSQVQSDAALDVSHSDYSTGHEVKEMSGYTYMDTWKYDDVDRPWSWGELFLPLYRIMVYALSKPEMPYF